MMILKILISDDRQLTLLVFVIINNLHEQGFDHLFLKIKYHAPNIYNHR